MEDKKELFNVVEKMNDKNLMKKEEIEVKDLMFEVKRNLAQYINSLIKNAVEEDELFSKVKQFLLSKVPTLEFPDLLRLFTTLDKKKVTTNEQLTGLLKPGNQSLSPLLEAFNNIKNDEKEDGYAKAFKEASSEDLRTLDKGDKMIKVLEGLADKIESLKKDENKDQME